MEFLAATFGFLISTILPFLVVLTIVVFFHELGHFLVARWNGVGVAKFAVGFGPDIFGFYDKKGTRWALSAIPLGGYVKFIDDANPSSMPGGGDTGSLEGMDESTFFANKKLWQKAAVVAAGPIANFILAIVIFAGIFYFNGRDIVSAQVDSIVEDSVAAEAGFEIGDLIIAADETPIEAFADLQRYVSVKADEAILFTVLRNDREVQIEAVPALREIDDGFGGRLRVGQLGIARSTEPSAVVNKQYGPIEAIVEGANETWFVAARTVGYIGGLITGRETIDQLSGPVRIADISAQVAAISIAALISLTAVLSVSIGIMNLLPIPILDGGHLVFYLVEAVRGRPVSEKTQEYCFKVGLVALLTMMVLVTTLDISRLLS